MKFEDLTGPKLKKALDAKRVRLTYHNRQNGGTGNFGFVIIFGDKTKDYKEDRNEKWFRIDGDYNSEKTIRHLSFGSYSGGGARGLEDMSWLELVAYMKDYVKKSINMKEY